MLCCSQQISDEYYSPPASPLCELQLKEILSGFELLHDPSCALLGGSKGSHLAGTFVLSLLILQLLENKQDFLADVSEKSSNSDKCS